MSALTTSQMLLLFGAVAVLAATLGIGTAFLITSV